MLYREIIVVCSQIHTRHKCTVWAERRICENWFCFLWSEKCGCVNANSDRNVYCILCKKQSQLASFQDIVHCDWRCLNTEIICSISNRHSPQRRNKWKLFLHQIDPNSASGKKIYNVAISKMCLTQFVIPEFVTIFVMQCKYFPNT